MEQNQVIVKECWDVSKIIAEVCQSHFNNTKREIASVAPDTTLNIPIWWGLPQRTKDYVFERQEGKIISFQKFVFYNLISYSHERLDFEHQTEISEKEMDLLVQGKGTTLKKETTTASVRPTQEIVWTNNIPEHIINEIINEIKTFYSKNSTKFLEKILINFPMDYNNLRDREKLKEVGGVALDGKDRTHFRAILAHELTHAFILKNSILKEEYLKAIDQDIASTRLSSIEDLREMFQNEMDRQAREVGFNPPLEVIEESFAFLITKEFYPDFELSEVTSGYEEGEMLPWLEEILVEKMNEVSPESEVDWLRISAVNVLDTVAREGQISYLGDKKSPYFYFIDHMKAERTSIILDDFNNLYSEFWELCNEHRQVKRALDNKLGSKYPSIEPEKLSKEIKLQAFNKGIESQYSSDEIHKQVEKILYSICKELDNILSSQNEINDPRIGKVSKDLRKFVKTDLN